MRKIRAREAVGVITTTAPLANGASTVVEFNLGVQTPGSFQIFVNVEALTGRHNRGCSLSKTQGARVFIAPFVFAAYSQLHCLSVLLSCSDIYRIENTAALYNIALNLISRHDR